MYLKNCWYAASLADDVGTDLVRRVVAEEAVLLYRHETSVVALADRCPHRFAPLSLGKRVGDGVQCGYHGLVFNAEGTCVHNPQGEGRILPSARVRSYPIVERHGLIWIWLGDPDRADYDLVPDFSAIDTQGARTLMSASIPTQAHYQILIDNILDLSHADYLHPVLDSGGGTQQEPPKTTENDDGSLDVVWTWGPSPAILPFHKILGEQPVHTHLSVRLYPPGNMHLRIASATTIEGTRSGPALEALHIMTPETALSTHYFFVGVRNFAEDDAAFTEWLKFGAQQAFAGEDKPMIEAVQRNMGSETDIFALQPLGLRGDIGGVKARQLLAKRIKAEQATMLETISTADSNRSL